MKQKINVHEEIIKRLAIPNKSLKKLRKELQEFMKKE